MGTGEATAAAGCGNNLPEVFSTSITRAPIMRQRYFTEMTRFSSSINCSVGFMRRLVGPRNPKINYQSNFYITTTLTRPQSLALVRRCVLSSASHERGIVLAKQYIAEPNSGLNLLLPIRPDLGVAAAQRLDQCLG